MTSTSRHSLDAVVIGVDYGTLSGRAVVVRVSDGQELGSAVHDYPHAVLDSTLPSGEPLPPEWALQVPADYIAVLQVAVPQALRSSGVDPSDVIGIGTDFTACTMVATLADGTPLCEVPEFSTSPHAFVKLWRHHAAQPQADRINVLARERGEMWLARYGGLISSEWEFAKGLQLLEEAPQLYAAMDHFVEAADWIVWQLTGTYVRNACTAGYKGMYQDGAYPDATFLSALNPDFASFVSDKLEHTIGQLGDRAGSLSARAAAWTGLPEGIAVAVGNVDAHVTAPAARAVEPGQMVAIMGTSTCHVMNATELHEVPGMCGVVDGGIVAGLWGYEAGQSGVGDIFGWFVKHCVPSVYYEQAEATGVSVHELLTDLSRRQAIGEHGLIALDWHSGNRSVLVDHELSGLVVGQTLATRAEDTYRALAYPGTRVRHGAAVQAASTGGRGEDSTADMVARQRLRDDATHFGLLHEACQHRRGRRAARQRQPHGLLDEHEVSGQQSQIREPRGIGLELLAHAGGHVGVLGDKAIDHTLGSRRAQQLRRLDREVRPVERHLVRALTGDLDAETAPACGSGRDDVVQRHGHEQRGELVVAVLASGRDGQGEVHLPRYLDPYGRVYIAGLHGSEPTRLLGRPREGAGRSPRTAGS